jgi:TM2 domain-containing membrane protein YozV
MGPPQFYKNPGLAAVLSFFYMGLGQIYNGQIGKGVAFIVIWTISWLLVLVLIGIITTPILWIFGMYDAYKSAEKINYDIAWRATQYGPAAGGPQMNQNQV